MDSNKNIVRVELKNFVDFIYSLVTMDEIKDGVFVKPKEIVYELPEDTHRKIHIEVKQQKGDKNFTDVDGDFEVDIFGVNIKFLNKDNE